jgi:hypothetical protein
MLLFIRPRAQIIFLGESHQLPDLIGLRVTTLEWLHVEALA